MVDDINSAKIIFYNKKYNSMKYNGSFYNKKIFYTYLSLIKKYRRIFIIDFNTDLTNNK